MIKLGIISENFPFSQDSNVNNVDVANFEDEVNGQKILKLSEENCPRLKSLLCKFSDVVSNVLPDHPMVGPPMEIELKENYVPYKLAIPRSISHHWRDEAKDLVRSLQGKSILCRENGVTEFVSPAHFVKKPGGGLRMVVDFTRLNQAVKRPIHPFPSAHQCVQAIPASARFYAVCDMVQGYHQIPLSEKASKLTTIILWDGKYRWLRGPMGLNSTGDEWCFRSDELVHPFTEWCRKLVDDVVIWASTLDELLDRMEKLFSRARKLKMTISRKKMQVSNQVKFAGYLLDRGLIRADPDKIKALSHFPTPKNITELRSFIGLANQITNFLPDLTHMTKTIRTLLKGNASFVWTPDMEVEFVKCKQLLSSDLYVHPYEDGLETELVTDAARCSGLGYMLLQKKDGKNRIIQAGSFAMTPTQTRYAVIETEMLGIVRAIQKCSYYLQGSPKFKVITDHKPLIGIFKKPLGDIENNRLLRLRMKVSAYDFDLEWRAGKRHLIADCLSRAPVFPAEEEEDDAIEMSELNNIVCSSPALNFLREAAAKDNDYLATAKFFLSGERIKKSTNLAYKNLWPNLSVIDSPGQPPLLSFNDRIVVPRPAISEVLKRLHLSHQGKVKTSKLARELYYWPGMSSAIENMVKQCDVCQQHLASNPIEKYVSYAPLIENVNEVWAIDLFSHEGRTYLALVDGFSGLLCCDRMNNVSTQDLINLIEKRIFEWGQPLAIVSDNGPQMRGPFKSYLTAKGIEHSTSSQYHPQGNSLAESAVKNAKRLLDKCLETGENFKSALFEFNNCPRATSSSPFDIFHGRKVRGQNPSLKAIMGVSSSDQGNPTSQSGTRATLIREKTK